MISFSTDDLRPQDRFDHWCEVRGKNLFGVTIELERERRALFQGRFSAIPVGNAVLAEMTASSYRVGRTKADIARVSSNSLSIGYQIRGPGHMDIGRGRVHRVREGDFTVSHSDQPFMGTPERNDGFHFRTLKIPLTDNILLGARAHDLAPGPLPGNTRLTRLIAAMFVALADPRPRLRKMSGISRGWRCWHAIASRRDFRKAAPHCAQAISMRPAPS